MSGRELGFALILGLGAALAVFGVSQLSAPAAWVVAGVLVALIGWLVLAER